MAITEPVPPQRDEFSISNQKSSYITASFSEPIIIQSQYRASLPRFKESLTWCRFRVQLRCRSGDDPPPPRKGVLFADFFADRHDTNIRNLHFLNTPYSAFFF